MDRMLVVLLALLCGTALGFAVARRVFAARQSQPTAGAPQADASVAAVQAAEIERQRIYRDIHDDIGSKLLTLLHSLDGSGQADVVREIMQDLRDVVSRGHCASASLHQVLGQIRDETEQRLDIAGGRLLWDIGDDVPDPTLSESEALHLFRISREAVTNALRHAGAQQLRIRARCSGRQLLLDYTDDGPQPHSESDSGNGAGVGNIRSRAEELHGQVNWTEGTQGGTKIVLEFPLPPESGLSSTQQAF